MIGWHHYFPDSWRRVQDAYTHRVDNLPRGGGKAGYHYPMTSEQPRTATNGRDRSPHHQYSLSIEQTAELYAQAGHPRTIRAIQKYCALSKLDCRKAETETGEKYLVAPYSVERHIAYIKEVRTDASGRDQTRPDANVRSLENKDETPPTIAANSGEQPRTDASVRGPDDRYLTRLESENDFLRGQMVVKDAQIKELTERARETNVLIAGLQKMLSPLLAPPGERRPDEANASSNDRPLS